MTSELNTYNFQTIIALNDHLIDIKTLDDTFDYISSYLKQDFNILKFSVDINNDKLYKNFDKFENLEIQSFSISLNEKEDLIISIYFEEKDFENIKSCIELIKVTFKIISQTIFNKYLDYKLKESSLKDHLTGLYNRQYIDEYLKSILPLSKRENNKIAFIKVGIDHFKAVIDEFDYNIGDKVLQELAKSLKSSIRKSDVAARIDSDEFFIVLHNISNENNAIIIADKIINNFKNIKVMINETSNQSLMKTICTGISIYPDDADEIDEIFRSSDIALYEARNKGRSQYFKFQKEANTIELF